MTRWGVRRAFAAFASVLVVFQFLSLGVSGLSFGQGETALAVAPGNEKFARTWARTDKPVIDGAAHRTWMWGPKGNSGVLMEPYAESPNGMREVQYFDKSRMEITHPDAYDDGLWYVTNGLLVNELVSGKMQLGDDLFEQYAPANVNVAGDMNDPTGPTYATFGPLRSLPPLADGSLITQRLSRDGTITNDPSLAQYGVTAAQREVATGLDHQIASVFLEFMRSTGTVSVGGQFVTDRLFVSDLYATGLPIAEAYWANVRVDGTTRDVLMQCFQRRCLTYAPGNDPAWRVEAGNVGLHYYEWRTDVLNEDEVEPTATATLAPGQTPTNTPQPTNTAPAGSTPTNTPQATNTPVPTNTPGSGGAEPTNTPQATNTPEPTNTPAATNTPRPTNTPRATNTPTNTPAPTNTPRPTNTPTNTPGSGGSGSEAANLNSFESEFLSLINQYRAQNGKSQLTVSRELNIASYRHSLDMGQRGYFSHDTPKPYPDGQTGPKFTDRMRAAGYCGYSAAGENIAAGQQTAQAVFNAWKDSSGHNANMLSSNFTQIGIGHAVVGGRTYWTTDFAKPSSGC